MARLKTHAIDFLARRLNDDRSIEHGAGVRSKIFALNKVQVYSIFRATNSSTVLLLPTILLELAIFIVEVSKSKLIRTKITDNGISFKMNFSSNHRNKTS